MTAGSSDDTNCHYYVTQPTVYPTFEFRFEPITSDPWATLAQYRQNTLDVSGYDPASGIDNHGHAHEFGTVPEWGAGSYLDLYEPAGAFQGATVVMGVPWGGQFVRIFITATTDYGVTKADVDKWIATLASALVNAKDTAAGSD